MVLLANEPFLGWPKGWVVSLSQEARRAGFCAGAAVGGISWRFDSGSSSELAKASESGVERLALSFSSKIDGLLADIDVKAGCPAFPLVVAFIVGACTATR
jgi:hypothetical protein